MLADFDNDGDLDILVGAGSTNESALLYLNDAQAHFREIRTDVPRFGLFASSADYDQDGRIDLCLTTYNGTERNLDLFRNLRGTNFVGSRVLSGYAGDVDSGDYDRDGLPDLLLASKIPGTLVYQNLGGLAFAPSSPIPFSSGPFGGFGRWGDANNDGLLDAVICGTYDIVNQIPVYGVGFLYQRAGGGFDNVLGLSLAPVWGSVAWGDFSNDGLSDFVVAGEASRADQYRLYTTVCQNGWPVNWEVAASLTGIRSGNGSGWIGWADYDRDGDLDLLVSGSSDVGRFTQLYRNDSQVTNTTPSAPFGLQSVVIGTEVRLQWGAAVDAQTPSPGLSYNIRVGTKPGGVDIVSPMSQPDGWRMVVQRGNADHRLFSKVVGLKGGTYYWSVQAVDTAFAGGPFAPEATFVVPPAIQGITLQSNGTVRIAMLGAPSVPGYVVQASTNLSSWTGVATLTADANGQFSYVETNVSTFPVRYYRVHSP